MPPLSSLLIAKYAAHRLPIHTQMAFGLPYCDDRVITGIDRATSSFFPLALVRTLSWWLSKWLAAPLKPLPISRSRHLRLAGRLSVGSFEPRENRTPSDRSVGRSYIHIWEKANTRSAMMRWRRRRGSQSVEEAAIHMQTDTHIQFWIIRTQSHTHTHLTIPNSVESALGRMRYQICFEHL